MKILYSPLGKSDPINKFHDGPWLHILRQVAPDLSVQLMSAEICEREDKNRMYSRTAELISNRLMERGERTSPILFEYRKERDMTGPHRRDLYTLMENDIRALHDRFPDAEIYLNCSSGTPAMKGSLEVMFHILPYRLVMCTVSDVYLSDEEKESNSRLRVGKDYDVDAEWELNEDNAASYVNRLDMMTVSTDSQLGIRLEKKQIERLIGKQEYQAALIAYENMHIENPELSCALKGAIERQQWNFHMAGIDLGNAGYPYAKQIKRLENDQLFGAAEAVLTMQIALERNDIGEMLRRLTPVMIPLITRVLAQKGIDVDLFTYERNGKLMIGADNLRKEYPACSSGVEGIKFKSDKPEEVLYDWHLLEILRQVDGHSQQYDMLAKLRRVEIERNDAAHKVCPVNAEKLKKEAKCTPEEVIALLRSLIQSLDGSYNNHYWREYQNMSEFIINLLNRH